MDSEIRKFHLILRRKHNLFIAKFIDVEIKEY